MPKKCKDSNRPTNRKKQHSETTSSKSRHSRKTVETCCSSVKPKEKRSAKKCQREAPTSAPPSCRSEKLSSNCDPITFKKAKTSRRTCSAATPTRNCSSCERRCRDKNKSLVKNERCCRTPKKNESLGNPQKPVAETGVKPSRETKACKRPEGRPKPSKYSKEKKVNTTVLKETNKVWKAPQQRKAPCQNANHAEELYASVEKNQICDPYNDHLLRPCNCWEVRFKPIRKKSNYYSKLFFCSCFTKFRNKRKKLRPAPCKRYFCLYNLERSEGEAPVPCVKCTHNCKARYFEANGKELPKTIPQPEPNLQSNASISSKSSKSSFEASSREKTDSIEEKSVQIKKKCDDFCADNISEKRSLPRGKKFDKKPENRKSYKPPKKSKNVTHCVTNESAPDIPLTIPTENKSSSDKISSDFSVNGNSIHKTDQDSAIIGDLYFSDIRRRCEAEA